MPECLAVWRDPARRVDVFAISARFQVEITEEEARRASRGGPISMYAWDPDGYGRLIEQRVLPMVWLSMPGHEA